MTESRRTSVEEAQRVGNASWTPSIVHAEHLMLCPYRADD